MIANRGETVKAIALLAKDFWNRLAFVARILFGKRKVSAAMRTGHKTHALVGSKCVIDVSSKGIWVNDSDGGWYLDPHKERGLTILISPCAVGVFCWKPIQTTWTGAVQSNSEMCQQIIRAEEEKAFALFAHSKPVIDRRLQGREPTEDDFTFLWETHGIDANLVNDFRDRTPAQSSEQGRCGD